MEYFKVIEHGSTATLEVNRDTFGDFIFRIISRNKGNRMNICLSETEAKDLSDFILKRLGEKKPDEVKQPF